jgi:hypothetical protein
MATTNVRAALRRDQSRLPHGRTPLVGLAPGVTVFRPPPAADFAPVPTGRAGPPHAFLATLAEHEMA